MFQFPSPAVIPGAHCRPPPKGLYDIESLKTTYNVMDISKEKKKLQQSLSTSFRIIHSERCRFINGFKTLHTVSFFFFPVLMDVFHFFFFLNNNKTENHNGNFSPRFFAKTQSS